MNTHIKNDPTLIEFIDQHIANYRLIPYNSYVKQPGFKSLYVRIGNRYLNGIICPLTLDIANVEVKKPGQGTFTRLIIMLKKKYPELTIYVESIQNQSFYGYLLERGFIRQQNNPLSLFLLHSDIFKAPLNGYKYTKTHNTYEKSNKS